MISFKKMNLKIHIACKISNILSPPKYVKGTDWMSTWQLRQMMTSNFGIKITHCVTPFAPHASSWYRTHYDQWSDKNIHPNCVTEHSWTDHISDNFRDQSQHIGWFRWWCKKHHYYCFEHIMELSGVKITLLTLPTWPINSDQLNGPWNVIQTEQLGLKLRTVFRAAYIISVTGPSYIDLPTQ